MNTTPASPWKVAVPRWDVERQNQVIKDWEGRGYCLVNCHDVPLGERELWFRKAN